MLRAGYSGKKFIFDKAKELGVRVVVVDGPDSWAKSLVRRRPRQRLRSRSAHARPVSRPGRRCVPPARRAALACTVLRRRRPLAPCRAVPAAPHCPLS